MSDALNDWVPLWKHWPAVLTELLGLTQPPEERARLLAEWLRSLAPAAKVAACQLSDGCGISWAPGAGTAPADAGACARLLPPPPKGGAGPVALGPGFSGLQGLGAVAGADERERVFLLLGVPAETPPEMRALLETLLGLAAHALSAQRRAAAAREERREVNDLITAGDAALGLVHDLNNHLNSMMLQAAVVQMQVAEPLREELAPIRREGSQAATRLRLLLRFRDLRRQNRAPVDLHQLLGEVLAECPEFAGRVTAEADSAAPVSVLRLDVKRLLTLLLRRVLACPALAGAGLRVRTAPADEGPGLQLIPVGAPAPEQLASCLDPAAAGGDVLSELERTAFQTLLRQTGGQLRSGDTPAGPGLLVTWKPREAPLIP
jgi:signal transduction histidine kinase